jgi:hypothetical protein
MVFTHARFPENNAKLPLRDGIDVVKLPFPGVLEYLGFELVDLADVVARPTLDRGDVGFGVVIGPPRWESHGNYTDYLVQDLGISFAAMFPRRSSPSG